MYRDEFAAIRTHQSPHHPSVAGEDWDLFEETVSLQAADGELRTIPLADLKEETRAARRADLDR